MSYDEKHQKLIEIMFEVMMHVTDKSLSEGFTIMTNEEKAEWLRKQLNTTGFKTVPCGMLWGILR